jgi:hypothetical protein
MTLAHDAHAHSQHHVPSSVDQRLAGDERWIEIDLSDLHLSSDMSSLDHRAEVATHIYERFVPYADEGWEWVVHPASPRFNDWVTGAGENGTEIRAARLLCRCANSEKHDEHRATHGMSGYRTRQLTRRLWSSEPASKVYRPVH